MTYIAITLSFIALGVASFSMGYHLGYKEVKLSLEEKTTIKVLKKKEPQTFKEERTEAIDKGGSMIKKFNK